VLWRYTSLFSISEFFLYVVGRIATKGIGPGLMLFVFSRLCCIFSHFTYSYIQYHYSNKNEADKGFYIAMFFHMVQNFTAVVKTITI